MSDEIWSREETESPCVKVCVIHPRASMCTGCLRTLEEIATWSQMGSDERRRIMDELPERRSQLAQRRGGRSRRSQSG